MVTVLHLKHKSFECDYVIMSKQTSTDKIHLRNEKVNDLILTYDD